jgi:hypothetical protein
MCGRDAEFTELSQGGSQRSDAGAFQRDQNENRRTGQLPS